MKIARIITGLLAVSVTVWGNLGYAQSGDAESASPASYVALTGKGARAEDRKLAKRVRAALARTRGVNVSNVQVRAKGGAVTVSGTVPSGEQVGAIEKTARTIPGVTSVNNKVGVRGIGP